MTGGLTWPATRPSAPTAFPRSASTRTTRSAGTPLVSRAMCSKAYDSRASPASTATSSPYTCAAPRPRDRGNHRVPLLRSKGETEGLAGALVWRAQGRGVLH